MQDTAKQVLRLDNPILNYAWGSRTAIAELLGRETPSREPEAELWMGTHPKAPSLIEFDGQTIVLSDWITRHPIQILGENVANRFGNQLPFLFKILAAAEPLSIQAHPDLEQARQGYERENRADIPLEATYRNYRDDNHKPEIICALTDFWGLNGFRPHKDLSQQLVRFCPENLASFHSSLCRGSSDDTLKKLFGRLMMMPASEKGEVISETIAHATDASSDDVEARWILKLADRYPGDIGILSPIILNLVHLTPGQAMYLPAGQLHAYLEGVGIELMANSDNVLRGGLTPKHIDVDELMQILIFEPSASGIMSANMISETEHRYTTPAEEFLLVKLVLSPPEIHTAPNDRNVEILLITEGQAELKVDATKEQMYLNGGDSILIPAAAGSYQLIGRAEVFMATVP